MSSCHLVILLALASWLFFYRLADRDLWSSHEARAAQDAQSILLNHSWGLPQLFDRHIELQKPPLYYWLVAAVAAARGRPVDAWAVRLPAACAGLGGVLLVYGLGRRRGRPLAGLLAAAVLATALHYTWLARTGRIDMPLAFTASVTLVLFYLGHCRRREQLSGAWGWFLGAYLATAAAVLLKGPIGLALPAAVVLAYLLAEGELPAPWRPKPWFRLAHEVGLWWGLPLLVGLALPWYLWANARTGGAFFEVFIWKHNIERGLGGGTLAAHPWWLYGPRLALDLLPWSPLLPVLAWLLVRRGWWRQDREARFGLAWLLAVAVVLSCARFKRADYLLPAYPGAALFLGSVLERCYRASRFPRAFAGVFVGILSAVALAWWLYLGWILPGREAAYPFQRFAAEIRRRAPPPQLVLFFRAESHPLAFHIGPPIDTLVEWENLDIWAGRPETYYVVMPPETAAAWPRHLKAGRLEEVLRSTDIAGRHARPLVLLRTWPGRGCPAP